jgi:hypothetical protein
MPAGTIVRPMMRVVQRRSKLQFVMTNAHGVPWTAGAGRPSPVNTPAAGDELRPQGQG